MKASYSKLAVLPSTLSFKLFIVFFLSVLLIFAGYTAISSRFQRRQLERQVKADATLAGDLIMQSLYTSMLLNERERTEGTIRLIGREPGVDAIRIFDKRGTIKFSSKQGEVGASVDLRAEACDVCHESVPPLEVVPTDERARMYQRETGYRVLGLISPIYNAEGCWNAGCHAHDAGQSVLGVLDVQMSLVTLDAALAASRRHAFTLAAGIVLFSMLVMAAIVYQAVHVPARKLQHGTEALARGDLDVRIDLDRSDELGALAKSFNQMALSLKAADAELRAWSQTLEDRVQEKTEELRRINQKMIQVEKSASLGTMAATVAHELNNPLSGILTCAKLVSKRVQRLVPAGDDRRQVMEALELIRSESTRCGRIVRDLLTYARHGTTEFTPSRLHGLVSQALNLVGHHIELSNVETLTDLQLEDDALICDGEQIVQALIAMMINAVEAMPEGGRLIVKTAVAAADPAGRVCVSVADTGVGIPAEALDKIFDPFYSTKDEAKGVGLGLAVVEGIVRRHAGEIDVVSEPGKGTTFTLLFPRDPGSVTGSRDDGALEHRRTAINGARS